ncbi:MAG TPA: hypothetical protein VF771_03675, partial [Longimicrobiaceae bacterium]
ALQRLIRPTSTAMDTRWDPNAYPAGLPYRQLYYAIRDYEGDALADEVLRPWLSWQDDERRWLDELRSRPGDPIPAIKDEESWELYALSRVVDVLNLSFAPWRGDAWKMPEITAEDMAAFMDGLGFERIGRPRFHPFFHEIVTVEQADDPAIEPEVVREHWPGWRLGPLLISRGGCRVRAGRDHVVKEIAETSTLYWAFARHTRPTSDLSVGWGSNSQWRTEFRRDYELGGTLYMHVDATPPPRPEWEDQELTGDERLELARHRCFVRCPKPHHDRFPYYDKAVESA